MEVESFFLFLRAAEKDQKQLLGVKKVKRFLIKVKQI